MQDDGYKQKLDAAKATSAGQLLFKCARLWNEQAIAQVQALTGKPVRVAHTRLFPHLDFEGSRATDLAKRAGISKQAVGKLLAEMEEMGMVERVPDPSDGRAQLVRWTAESREGLLQGLTLLRQMEGELAMEIGWQRMAALHDGLTALLAALERRGG